METLGKRVTIPKNELISSFKFFLESTHPNNIIECFNKGCGESLSYDVKNDCFEIDLEEAEELGITYETKNIKP